MTSAAAADILGRGVILAILFFAIGVIISIIVLKIIVTIITNTVIDTIEHRGYGKGVWKK